MRGILAFAGYVPYHRLERSAMSEASGTNAGKGTRSVASYDEDTTTMAVEAARLALRPLGESARTMVNGLWFSTTTPAYVDKTNATIVHAALRLNGTVNALDANGSVRSASGVLQSALRGNDALLVIAADTRTGLPTSADEREGGDAAAALLVGEGTSAVPVLAEFIGGSTLTEEFLDRWRTPGDVRSKQWEERFGETRYVPLGQQAWDLALKDAGLAAADIARVVVTGTHTRAVRQLAKALAIPGASNDDLTSTIGNPGAAQPTLLLADALEHAKPNDVVALVVLADGADVMLFRATDAVGEHQPARSVAAQIQSGHHGLRYLQFLSWTGMVTIEPPRRPEPARASASASTRNQAWKFGLVASRDRSSGALHLPPSRVSYQGGAVDDMDAVPMADAQGTIVTFTVDRLAYSPSPPIVFVVVDFDPVEGADAESGGRMPIELTDGDASGVAIGQRVELTFRRLNRSDGIQNYFWKAKPLRDGP